MGFGIKTAAHRIGHTLRYHRIMASTPRARDLDVLLLAHALEKGMGTKEPRHGFGQEKCRKLILSLETIAKANGTSSYSYCVGMAILKAYLQYQEASDVDVSKLRAAAERLPEAEKDAKGGYVVASKDELLQGTEFDFSYLVTSKRSVRDFSSEEVTREEVLEAVALAERAPSACNREPWKIYWSLDRSICRVMADALPPQAFLDDVPYFGVVTVDRSLFNESEVYQWFINGGIFVAYFTLALHSLGIGSIVLEYNVFSKSARTLRSRLGIPRQEEIVAVVGYGKYASSCKLICADRRPVSEVAVEVS